MCAALDKAGIQIHVHSIGDAATRITLDGFAYARQQNGARDARDMITHLQLVNKSDIARFADLGVIAVPQPYWFVVDTYYHQAVEYVGQERADKQYPMKSFFDAGVTVASASDYPVSWPPDPMLAIELGITRTVPEGSEIYVDPDYETALWPAECVTVEQMIESFTINGAQRHLQGGRDRFARGRQAGRPGRSQPEHPRDRSRRDPQHDRPADLLRGAGGVPQRAVHRVGCCDSPKTQ